MLFVTSLYKYTAVSPDFQHYAMAEYNACKDVWWTNLLYISNLYPLSNNVSQYFDNIETNINGFMNLDWAVS